jgi:hypothetical protein
MKRVGRKQTDGARHKSEQGEDCGHRPHRLMTVGSGDDTSLAAKRTAATGHQSPGNRPICDFAPSHSHKTDGICDGAQWGVTA